MEALMATVTSFAVFLVGLLARCALLPLVLLLFAVPIVVVAVGLRGAGMLWQRATGLVCVNGLWWKPGFYYAPGHTWISQQGAALQIGLDDLAQRVLVSAQAIVLPRPGEEVHEGEAAAVVACGNKHAEIVSPVDGVVTAVNEAVCRDPSVIHRDPYMRGWLYAVAPKNTRYTRLPRGESTRRWFRDEGARLAQFLEHNLGVAAADGGEFLFPAPSLLSDEQWAALTSAFLGRHVGREAGMASGSRGPLDRGSSLRIPRALVPFAPILAPIAGGLYIVLLPVIGLFLLVGFAGLWTWRGLRYGIDRLGRSSLGNRRPTEPL